MNRTGLPMAASPPLCRILFYHSLCRAACQIRRGRTVCSLRWFRVSNARKFRQNHTLPNVFWQRYNKNVLFQNAALHVVRKNRIAPIYRRQDGPAVSSGHPCPAIGGKPLASLRCARGAFVFPGQAPCGGAVPGFLFLPRRESPVLNMLCIFLEEETPWKNSFI